MEKLLKILCVISLCCVLVGCTIEKEKSGVSLETETSVTIGKGEITEIEEIKKKKVEIKHNESIDGKEVLLKPYYAIDEEKVKNWYFTQSSSIDLGLNIEAVPKGYNVLVSQIYADISLLSQDADYNGIRQDSINVEYFSLPNGGISFNKKDGFKIPFQIEAVDKSETFFYMWNGYGTSSSYRITENDIAKVVEGAVLNVVWTVIFENKDTGEQFVKTINDRIGIPYEREVIY